MAEAKAKWDEVGDRFTALAQSVKERYEANAPTTEEQKQKVNDALRDIGDALDAGFTALGDSLRDPSMRVELKQAGASIAEALATTFSDVAAELKKAVKRDQ